MDRKVLAAALISTFIFSATFAIIRLAVKDVNPIGLATLRSLFGAIALLGFVIVSGKWNRMVEIFKDNWKILTLLAFLGVTLFDIVQNLSLEYTYSLSAGILQTTLPLVVLIMGYFILDEKITENKLVGIIVGIIGAVIVTMPSGVDFARLFGERVFIGNMIVLLGVIISALYTVLSKSTLKKVDSVLFTTIVTTLGFLLLIPFAVATGTSVKGIGLTTWSYIAYLGIGASGIAFLLFFYALEREEASRIISFHLLIPVLATLIGVTFLNEPFGLQTAFGGILTIFGVYMVQKARK